MPFSKDMTYHCSCIYVHSTTLFSIISTISLTQLYFHYLPNYQLYILHTLNLHSNLHVWPFTSHPFTFILPSFVYPFIMYTIRSHPQSSPFSIHFTFATHFVGYVLYSLHEYLVLVLKHNHRI